MKRILLVLAILAAAASLCAPAFGADPEKIVIGSAETLSGQHAKAGEQAVAGVKACVEWVNTVYGGVKVGGKKLPLEYKYYDCESKKESVTSLLERLITTDKVNVIFAPYSSGLTLAGAPVAEKYGIVYMDHGGASDKIFEQGFKYAVQTIGPGTLYHTGTLDMIRKVDPGAKRLALAYKDDEFARSVMDGAVKYAPKLGFEIIFNRTYPQNVTDLTPLLSDLKASNPDVILGGGHFQDGQLFTKQCADLGINPKALSLIAAVTLPQFGKDLGNLADGVMGPSHWEYGVTYSAEKAKKEGITWIGPSQDEYVALFKKNVKEGVDPEYHSAEAGAAVLALVLAVEKAGSLDSDAVRKALGEIRFMSFYGGWDVDDTGKQVGHAMVDVQWQQGKRVIVWPEAARMGDLTYPKPKF